MDITGKRVMVLGGYGQVGFAVCRRLAAKEPGALILTSLRETEARDAAERLRLHAPPSCLILPFHGNLFVRWDLKDISTAQMATDQDCGRGIADDIMEELTEEILTSSTLYRLILEHRPEIIIDCLNTATALSYQNIYQCYGDVREGMMHADQQTPHHQWLHRMVGALCIPPLVRHVQILYGAMMRAQTSLYLKVGTTGTGGMGVNIPFTHGEEKPSRLLLSKAAVAGAHTQLLYTLSRTPGAPIVKELVPAALIGWKGVQRGPVPRAGDTIPMYDCAPKSGYRLAPGASFRFDRVTAGHALAGRVLEGVYVDTGENGVFSLHEFETVTALGLMEFLTPEEIADAALAEIQGATSTADVLGAMAGAVMGPSYRAGFLRHQVIARMRALGGQGVAYTQLGPFVAKAIYECHLIGLCYSSMEKAVAAIPEEMSAALAGEVERNQEWRAAALSFGIPILMPDGTTLLWASRPHPDKRWEKEEWIVTPETIDRWAREDWIDLRPVNMALWQERLSRILADAAVGVRDTSSYSDFGGGFWRRDERGRITIDAGEVVGYVLRVEEAGGRGKE